MGFYVCIAPALPLEKTWARALIVAIGIAVAVRYLAWRLFETLVPEVSMSLEGAWFLGHLSDRSAHLPQLFRSVPGPQP